METIRTLDRISLYDRQKLNTSTKTSERKSVMKTSWLRRGLRYVGIFSCTDTIEPETEPDTIETKGIGNNMFGSLETQFGRRL